MISSLGQHTVSDYVLVRIGTDAGIDGVGEATVMPRWSGETVWGCRALIDRSFVPRCSAAKSRRSTRSIVAWKAFASTPGSPSRPSKWPAGTPGARLPAARSISCSAGACRPLTYRCRFSMGAYDLDRARSTAANRVATGLHARSKSKSAASPTPISSESAPCAKPSARSSTSTSTPLRLVGRYGDSQSQGAEGLPPGARRTTNSRRRLRRLGARAA